MAFIGLGCDKLLEAAIENVPLVAHLFTNDHEPTIGDDIDAGDYDEADFSGYSPLPLSAWDDSVVEEGRAYAEHALAWNPGTGATGAVYGVFVMDSDNDELVFAVRFPNPLAVVDGSPIAIRLRLAAQDSSLE